MKMRFSRPSAPSVALASCLALAFAAGPAQSGSQEPFHAARSAPEKALNEIFHHSDNDDNLSEFVLKRPGTTRKRTKATPRCSPQTSWRLGPARKRNWFSTTAKANISMAKFAASTTAPSPAATRRATRAIASEQKRPTIAKRSFPRDGREKRRAPMVRNIEWRKRAGAGGSTASIAAMARSSI
jgi:hypothetical protein